MEDWLFLAMAYRKTGNAAEANVWLTRATDEWAKIQTGAALSDGRPLSWWLRAEVDGPARYYRVAGCRQLA